MKKLILLVVFISPACWALDLDGFLTQMKNHHKGFQSYDISVEAAKDRLEAGDISLVPVLSMKGSWLEDKKQPNFRSQCQSFNAVQFRL